ncbi:DUF3291 domain-containing protein [Pedobacter sp. BS3]|nr:DUF3291 domain-containing protein [Pedobacter sp. BS3]
MAVHRLPLLITKGCTFRKLLGSGKNGEFTLQPDLQQWALLTVWKTQDDCDRFYRTSFIARWWHFFGCELWTITCEPLSSHGQWNGKNPFATDKQKSSYEGPVVVLTRATIRLSKVKSFWKHVADVAKMMAEAPGYITSFSIGEAPLFLQATFSIWQDADSMKTFAYQSQQHSQVIRKTREENWYSEELFARFIPIKTDGTIKGKDPLKSRKLKVES